MGGSGSPNLQRGWLRRTLRLPEVLFIAKSLAGVMSRQELGQKLMTLSSASGSRVLARVLRPSLSRTASSGHRRAGLLSWQFLYTVRHASLHGMFTFAAIMNEEPEPGVTLAVSLPAVISLIFFLILACFFSRVAVFGRIDGRVYVLLRLSLNEARQSKSIEGRRAEVHSPIVGCGK